MSHINIACGPLQYCDTIWSYALLGYHMALCSTGILYGPMRYGDSVGSYRPSSSSAPSIPSCACIAPYASSVPCIA
eukprot:1141953-Rhodomonas_salina.1